MLASIRISQRRSKRVRLRIKNLSRMRISVFRSNRHFYVQVINDNNGMTLVSASTLENTIKRSIENKGLVNETSVKAVAELIVDKLKGMQFNQPCVFDRGSYPYKGNIKLFADHLRSCGVEF